MEKLSNFILPYVQNGINVFISPNWLRLIRVWEITKLTAPPHLADILQMLNIFVILPIKSWQRWEDSSVFVVLLFEEPFEVVNRLPLARKQRSLRIYNISVASCFYLSVQIIALYDMNYWRCTILCVVCAFLFYIVLVRYLRDSVENVLCVWVLLFWAWWDAWRLLAYGVDIIVMSQSVKYVHILFTSTPTSNTTKWLIKYC